MSQFTDQAENIETRHCRIGKVFMKRCFTMSEMAGPVPTDVKWVSPWTPWTSVRGPLRSETKMRDTFGGTVTLVGAVGA